MVDKLPRCFTLWLHPLVHLANDHLWCDGATQSESWQPFFSCLPQIYTFPFPTGPGVTYYCQWRKSTRIQNLKELEQNRSLRTRQLLQCFLNTLKSQFFIDMSPKFTKEIISYARKEILYTIVYTGGRKGCLRFCLQVLTYLFKWTIKNFSLERNPHSVSKCCQMTSLWLINRLLPIYHKTARMFVKNCCTHPPFTGFPLFRTDKIP